MRFSKVSVLSALLVTAQASAWTTTSQASLSLFARSSATRSSIAAVQLHSTASISEIETKVDGEEDTESFRLKFADSGSLVSPWHDIPLKNEDGSFNMVRRFFGPLLLLIIWSLFLLLHKICQERAARSCTAQ